MIRLLQMRVLDKRRLVEHWGDLSPETMQKVDEAKRKKTHSAYRRLQFERLDA